MLLILGGTGEARGLAERVAEAGVPATLSLAGATRAPLAQALPTRIGGFGGEDGFRAYLAEAGITAILDATHPFAHRVSARSARVADELGLPYAILSRPEWQAEAGDIWHEVDSPSDVGPLTRPGDVVFLATGRQTLQAFGNLQHSFWSTAWLILTARRARAG